MQWKKEVRVLGQVFTRPNEPPCRCFLWTKPKPVDGEQPISHVPGNSNFQVRRRYDILRSVLGTDFNLRFHVAATPSPAKATSNPRRVYCECPSVETRLHCMRKKLNPAPSNRGREGRDFAGGRGSRRRRSPHPSVPANDLTFSLPVGSPIIPPFPESPCTKPLASIRC